ncbi:hypothetical protein [Pseudomonas sp. PS01299]|uniref:hypothetical protein n=1 Tax=Pseudomonas sp. PS01299 TaxID=2991435 RepID=UPI00249C7C4E|nr:hypothetical protein [Pseudomonas sp. PS01299]
MGQKLAAYNTQGGIVAFYDSVESPPPDGCSFIEITDEEWQQCISTPGFTVNDGVLVAPAPIDDEQVLAQEAAAAWAALQAAARAALYASDITVLRCYEGTVAVPSTWVDYRKGLRSIVTATSNGSIKSLPARPEYPAGT